MQRMLSLVALVLLGISVVYAQSPAIESSTDGRLPEWSVDSRIFAYQNNDKDLPATNSTNSEVFMEYPYWEAFNPNTGEWFESTSWPLYPDLSDEEKAIFQTEGFMRISPDGEILVYPSLENRLLTIANRATKQIFETKIDYDDGVNQIPLLWSEDSQGFAVTSVGPSPYELDPKVNYVRLRDPLNLTHTVIYPIEFVQPARIGNRLFRPVSLDEILDVHQHLVLMTLSDVTNEGNAAQSADEAQSYLVIWNPENPDNSMIINAFNGVHKATFVPGNPQLILLVLLGDRDLSSSEPAGVYLYDTITQETVFLTGFPGYEINHIDTQFSPDGEWLVVPKEDAYQFGFFSTRDLLAMPPQFKATPFPTFTPFPTYTPTPELTSTPSPTLSS